MNRQLKTSHMPAARRGRSLVPGPARCLMAAALVLVAIASLCVIARRAGATDSEQSSATGGRVEINSSAAEKTAAPTQDKDGGVPGCVEPPAGLTAWYAGDGNALDLQGGSSATLNGNANSVTFAPGKVAQAFQFNGGGELRVADQAALDVASAFTLDAWVNPVAGNDFTAFVFKQNNLGGSYALFLQGDRRINFRVGNDSTFDAVSSNAQIPLDAYTHIAATYNGTTISIYINGNLDASKTLAFAPANSDGELRIGGGGFGNYRGAIDELEIFNRALSQSEIQSIVAADSAGKCKDTPPPPPPPTACITPPANLTVWFPLDGDTTDQQGGDSAVRSQAPGTVTVVPGKVAQALHFQGGDVRVTDAPAHDATNALTLDAWVKPDDVPGGQYGGIFFKGNAGGAGGDQPYSLFYNSTGGDSNIQFRVGNATTFDTLSSFGPPLPFDSYTHVAATYDGTTMRLYINGELNAVKTTNIGPLANSNLPLVIGGPSYLGSVDELEIFNRVLPLSEIQLLYAAGSFGKCKTVVPTPPPQTACVTPPANMIAWFPFDNNLTDIRNTYSSVGTNPPGREMFAAGKVAQAIQFNGSYRVEASETVIGQNPTNALTLDAWVNPTSADNGGSIVFKQGPNGTQPYSLFINPDRTITMRVGNSTTFEGVGSFAQIPLNAYSHIAGTYDGTRVRIYINGNLDTVKTVSIGTLIDSDETLYVGAFFYQGAVDELEIFSRVLSEAEIKLLVAADQFGKCKVSCTPITLSPSSLANGTVGMPYDQTISASGSPGPYTFNVTSGSLPPGLMLNSSTGQINGTPTATGTFNFTVTATGSGSCTGSQAYSITVSDAPTPTPTPTPTPNCVAPPSGMTAWLPGDGNVQDITGNNNHGTLQNGATFAPGKVAQAFSFDGVDDYVLVNHSQSLASTAVTVDLWAYPTAYGQNYNRFVEKGGAGASDPGGYSLEFNPCANGQPSCAQGTQGVAFVIWSDTVGPFVTLNSSAPIPLNTWTHIAGTFDGSTMSLYINGVLQGSATATMGSTTDNLAIGRSPNFASHHFNGQLDEVEIFNRALSQAEIQSIVAAGSFGKCKPNAAPRRTPFDFDGDGKTDVSFWNPTSHNWVIQNSSTSSNRLVPDWGGGNLGDIAVPRDYDGDGKTDLGVFRPSEGNWYIILSQTNTVRLQHWGNPTDLPVPADYDGDGKTDIAVYRPSEGTWYFIFSETGTITGRGWGLSTDIPVPGLYDTDGKADIAVYRPSEGNWYIINSATETARLVNWGAGADQPVLGDFDGDGRGDFAVFRPSEGNWYIKHSGGGATIKNWGDATDKLVPGDYDGDGKTDVAIFRPSEANWYIILSQTNTGRLVNFGQGVDDVPAPSTYIPR